MREQANSSEGISHSLTDLMTSIAVIFILLFLVFVKNEQEAIAIRERVTQSNIEYLFAQLSGEFSGDIKVDPDPDDPLTLEIVLRDDPDLLSFERNGRDVSEKGKGFLRGFIPRLTKIICSPNAEPIIDSIIIQGHTDSSGDDDVNTKFSTDRATAVLIESRSILAAGEHPGGDDDAARLERCFLHFSQATGRGRQELISDAAGKEDAKKSRRVVVKIRVKSLEQREAPKGAS